MIVCFWVSPAVIEWIKIKSQAVPDPVQWFGVLSGRLGRRILHHEGAHRQPQEFRAQVWFRKLHCEKVQFSSTWRFVFLDFSIILLIYLFILLILLQDATLLWDVNKYVCSDADLSNLMVMRQGAKLPVHCESSSQLRFHPIKERQIVKVRVPASSLLRSCVSSYVTGFQCWCFFF